MKFLLKYLLVAMVLLAIQCCEDDGREEKLADSVREVQATIGDKIWAGEGSYLIAFGGTPNLFSLSCKNDSSQFNIELRASATGTYQTIEDGYYYSIKEKVSYKIISGTVTISEVTNENKATGSFEFSAKDELSEKVINVKEGKFNKVNGMGYW
jgi:hypothetical protein